MPIMTLKGLLILRQIRALYRIETRLRADRAGPALHEAMLASGSRMIFERLGRLLRKLKTSGRFLPKSNMGRTLDYALSNWHLLSVFLEEGRVEIDTNRVENAIRPTAIGKKNWLFVGHAQAGQKSAILYTIVEACRKRGIDPFTYPARRSPATALGDQLDRPSPHSQQLAQSQLISRPLPRC